MGLQKKLLISAISFAATVGILEVTLRLAFAPYVVSIYELDARCLFRPRANAAHYAQTVPPNAERRVLVSVDSRGYRDADRPFAEDELRVMVFGDSFVMAEFSPVPESYCARLELELAARTDQRVHVINAGAAGAGPDQYVSRIADEVARVRPHAVVVAIYAGNDFGDLVRNKMFRVTADGEVVPNAFTFSDKLNDQFALAAKPAIQRLIHRFRSRRQLASVWRRMDVESPAERVCIARNMVEVDLGMCRQEYREYVVHGRNDVRAPFSDHYDSDIALEPDGESARYKTRLMQGVFAALAATARAVNVPLWMVTIPSPVDVVPDYRGGTVDVARWPNYRASRLTDMVVRIAEENAIPCIDLFDAFAARGAELYLHAPDVHWNAAGQALGAEITAKAIGRQLQPGRRGG